MYALLKQDQELERMSHDLGQRIRRASPSEREKLTDELQTALNKHFDVRQERRELQIRRMEEELKRLRDSIGKRSEARDAIVKKRLNELTGAMGDLDF